MKPCLKNLYWRFNRTFLLHFRKLHEMIGFGGKKLFCMVLHFIADFNYFLYPIKGIIYLVN